MGEMQTYVRLKDTTATFDNTACDAGAGCGLAKIASRAGRPTQDGDASGLGRELPMRVCDRTAGRDRQPRRPKHNGHPVHAYISA
jgi:hypothetical protein